MALLSFEQTLLALVGVIVLLAGVLVSRHQRRKAENETSQPS